MIDGDLQKKIYEGLDAVWGKLDDDGQQLLFHLVEDLRSALAGDNYARVYHTGRTLKRWADNEPPVTPKEKGES